MTKSEIKIVVSGQFHTHAMCSPTFLLIPVDVCFTDFARLILRGWSCIRVHKNDIWASGREEGGNKCTGGDEVHTLRLILNNFLIAGAQLFHLDGNLYHSTDMVNINIKLISFQSKHPSVFSCRRCSFSDVHLKLNTGAPNGGRQE